MSSNFDTFPDREAQHSSVTHGVSDNSRSLRTTERPVVVIGGGISGLVAAYRLKQAGKEVVLYDGALDQSEGEDIIGKGGVMNSSSQDGFTLETGPQVLVTKPALCELLGELQKAQPENADALKLIGPTVAKYRQQIFWKGRAVDVPKSLIAALKTPLLKIPDYFRIAKSFMGRREIAPAAVDESVAVFMGRILGERVVREVLAPALRGIYGGDISQLSARSIFPGLWNHVESTGQLKGYAAARQSAAGGASASKRGIAQIKGGSAALIDALWTELEGALLLADKVKSVRYDHQSGEYEVYGAATGIRKASSVFIATSGAASSSFLGALSPQLASQLSRVRYTSIAVVQVALPRNSASASKIPKDCFGVLLPETEKTDLMGVMYNSEVFPHVAPADQHLVTCCVGGLDAEERVGQSDLELTNFVTSELVTRLKVSASDISPLVVRRWQSAIPQYECGHFELVNAMRGLEDQLPGLKFIGSDNGGVGVPDRIAAATSAVESYLNSLKVGRRSELGLQAA